MKKFFWVWLVMAMMLPLAGGEILFRNGFDSEKDFSCWKAIPGWSYSANGGRNGTGAAVLTRNGFSGPLTSVKLDSLKPGVLYRLTVWVKPENLQSDGKSRNYGGFCVEFVKDGKWMSGYYPLTADLSGKWHKRTLEFMLKPGAQQTSIVLYIRKGFKGTLYFDDVLLEEAGDPKAAILVNEPAQLTFFGTSGDLKISGCSSDDTPKLLSVKISGKEFNLETVLPETSPGQFHLKLTNLKPGVLDVKMVLRSSKEEQKVIASAWCKLFVRPDGKQKSRFDKVGNLYIDGKKFMPIGIFGGFGGVEDLKKISDAGFNTILNYSSFGMTFGGTGKNHLDTMLKSLDVIAQHDLKLLFSLKDQYAGMRHAMMKIDDVTGLEESVAYTVNNLKNHPALLGWYVSDENNRSELPAIIALRELIASHDPDHPSITLTFRKEDLPIYAAGGDVIAVDYYPFVKSDDKEFAPVFELLHSAGMSRQPVWMVPQIFNWGVFKAKSEAEFRQFVYPERKEIKALLIASVIAGSKGFIFYSYSDICGARGRKFFPENEAPQWANTVAAVAMLKKLEPFIMSDFAPEIIVDNRHETVARLRNDSGKTAVVAIRKESGKSRLVLPCSENYTLTDGSAEFSGKNWVFCGSNIDFCILMEK